MGKEYRHKRFKSDKAFLAYHQERAAEGNEESRRIVDTQMRVELARLANTQRNRELSRP